MEFHHVPVLLDAVLESLDIKPDGIYVDGQSAVPGMPARLQKGPVLEN